MAVQQRERASVEGQPRSVGNRKQARIDERAARLACSERTEEQHAGTHRDEDDGDDARDHVAMKDGNHLSGGVLHRGDDDMTRVM